MKKTLAALAVLGAFAGSAMAADVQLYGRIDTGFVYTDTDAGHSLQMKSGYMNGSRWGVKGTEDLGNGMKVGFTLESGFNVDDGKSGQGGRLFGRQATLSVSGDFGTVLAGRMGSIASDMGTMGLIGDVNPMGTSFDILSVANTTGSEMTRYDNVLGYISPKFGGLEVRAQYMMGDAADNKSVGNNRIAVLGAKYNAGALTLVGTAEYYMYANAAAGQDTDEGLSVIFGGNYKTDFATFYGFVNYFQDAKITTDVFSVGAKDKVCDGYGASFVAKVPAFGGNVLANVSYRDMEASDKSAEGQRLQVAGGYLYSFSKRTSVYAVGGYVDEEWNEKSMDGFQVGAGIVHKF